MPLYPEAEGNDKKQTRIQEAWLHPENSYVELNPFIWHHSMTNDIHDHNYDFPGKDKL